MRSPATRIAALLGIIAGLMFGAVHVHTNATDELAIQDDSEMARRILRRLDAQIAAEKGRHTAPKLGRGIAPKDVLARSTEMMKLDQLVRTFPVPPTLPRKVRREVFDGIAQRMRAVDKVHTKELKRFVRRNEWPRLSQYGPRTTTYLWLIVQHADHNREFQRHVLEQMGRLLKEDDIIPSHYAYLYDRVAVGEKRLQRFATQGRCVARNAWEAWPVDKPHFLDRRRKRMGMQPYEDYRREASKMCADFGR